jgi:Zn-finger nucleic acid-binding protein
MKCPKCGGTMVEKRFDSVLIEECTACKGVYFDAGEIDLLLKHEKVSSGVFGRLFSR